MTDAMQRTLDLILAAKVRELAHGFRAADMRAAGLKTSEEMDAFSAARPMGTHYIPRAVQTLLSADAEIKAELARGTRQA